MLDLHAAASLLARATLAYDTQNIAGFLNCFTHDVAMRITLLDGRTFEINGRDELLERSPGLRAPANRLRHLVYVPDFEILSDNLVRATYQQLYVWVGAEPSIAGAGIYVDLLQLEQGTWLIAEREHRFLSPPPAR